MKCVVQKSELVRVVEAASAASKPASSMPILGHLLLEADESGELRVSGQDQVTGVLARAAAKVEVAGTYTVEAKAIKDVARRLPEGEISLTVKPDDNGRLVVRGGKSRSTLPTMPGEDFPPLATVADEEVEVPGPALSALLSTVSPAVSSDDTRPHLNVAMLVLGDGKVMAVATDGHRLAHAESKVELEGAYTVGITHAAIGLVSRLLNAEPAYLSMNAHYMRCRVGTTEVMAKLIDAPFPPYKRVVPDGHKTRIRLPRADLAAVLKRAMVFACDKMSPVELKWSKGEMQVQAQHIERGDSFETMPVDIEKGKTAEVSVCAVFLQDALKSAGTDEVLLEASDPLDPLIVRSIGGDLDVFSVVMPMRGR